MTQSLDVPASVQASDLLTELAAHLAAIERLTRDPALAHTLGEGLMRELRYPAASFRQRFPASWPGGQQSLFGGKP
jgi:hypothetical protein